MRKLGAVTHFLKCPWLPGVSSCEADDEEGHEGVRRRPSFAEASEGYAGRGAGEGFDPASSPEDFPLR